MEETLLIGVATKDNAAALTVIMWFPLGAIYWMICETFSKYEAFTHHTVSPFTKSIQYGPVAHLKNSVWDGVEGWVQSCSISQMAAEGVTKPNQWLFKRVNWKSETMRQSYDILLT